MSCGVGLEALVRDVPLRIAPEERIERIVDRRDVADEDVQQTRGVVVILEDETDSLFLDLLVAGRTARRTTVGHVIGRVCPSAVANVNTSMHDVMAGWPCMV